MWLVAIYPLATSIKGVSSMKLHRDLGITQKSAWHLAHRMNFAGFRSVRLTIRRYLCLRMSKFCNKVKPFLRLLSVPQTRKP